MNAIDPLQFVTMVGLRETERALDDGIKLRGNVTCPTGHGYADVRRH